MDGIYLYFVNIVLNICYWDFNSLPNENILALTKLKGFAEDKLRQTKCDSKNEFVFGRIESIVGKGENVGYQHFLLVPQCYQQVSYTRLLKVVIVL